MIQPTLHKLSNGIPVIIDYLPYSESLTFGVYIKSGARNEREECEFGISHLLEHMALKGTKKRHYREITESVENVGGNINAYTTSAITSYHATVPCAHRELIIDIISDIVINPTFPAEEFELEKQVVIQELKSYEDYPESVIYNRMCDAVFRGGLRHDIGGTIDSVRGISRDQMADFYKKHYSAKNSVIVISGGGIDNADEILAEIEKYFGTWGAKDVPDYVQSDYVNALSHTKRGDLSHTYFNIVWRARPSVHRNDSLAQSMTLRVLGIGFGSRLFQEVREKQGLVYVIRAAAMTFEDIGVAIIESQTERAKIDDAIRAVANVIRDVKDGVRPITEIELTRAREMAKGGLLMGLDSSFNRTDYFAARYLHYGELDDIAENIRALDAVTLDDVNAAACELFKTAPSVITLGVEHELPLDVWQKLF